MFYTELSAVDADIKIHWLTCYTWTRGARFWHCLSDRLLNDK